MKYQKIINLLDITSNQPCKFRTKNWIEKNDSYIRFKATMIKSTSCDYSYVYILVKGRITITRVGDTVANRQADERNKGIVFKKCAPFTSCKSEINNTEIDNAKGIDIVMPMYNLIEYSDNYSKTSGTLWQYYRGDNFTDSESFKSKIKIVGNTPAAVNTKDVEIIALEISLINCEVNHILTWSSTCVITNSTGAA